MAMRKEIETYLAALSAVGAQDDHAKDDWLFGTLTDLAEHVQTSAATPQAILEDLVILCCHGHWSRKHWVCDQAGTGESRCPLGDVQAHIHARCKWIERSPGRVAPRMDCTHAP